MLFEILLQLVFQVPVINIFFNNDNKEILKMIPKVLGVEKYYSLEFNENKIPTLTEVTDFKSLG